MLVKIICAFCDTAFFVYPCRKTTAKYCSTACLNNAKIGVPLSSECKAKIGMHAKGIPRTEAVIKKISAAKMGHVVSEETRKKISTSCMGRTHSEEAKRKIGRASKGNKHANGAKHTDEWKRENSERMRGNKHSVGKNKGENNPNWRGGSAYLPYCPAFNKTLKEQIRAAFGRRCFICNKTEAENGKKLDVHHCDYNKGQGCGQRWSLVPLCHRCHAATSNNRHYYFNLLNNYWILNHDIVLNVEMVEWRITR